MSDHDPRWTVAEDGTIWFEIAPGEFLEPWEALPGWHEGQMSQPYFDAAYDALVDVVRDAAEVQGLRDQLAAAQAVIREALDTASTRGMAMEDKYDAVLSILHDAAEAIAQAQGHQP